MADGSGVTNILVILWFRSSMSVRGVALAIVCPNLQWAGYLLACEPARPASICGGMIVLSSL